METKETKLVKYSIALNKQLGMGETMQVQLAVREGDSIDEINGKVNEAFGLFDARVLYNNQRTMEITNAELDKLGYDRNLQRIDGKE